MENTITMTPELYNLLTLTMDDQLEDYTREDILQMVEAAWKSIQTK